ncbi:hypothetical protein HDU97_006849 [Phlyctochytrium planicorne]|nr:hypothetical protein HDU97_006849 [Phlyctochytrium planicorne]
MAPITSLPTEILTEILKLTLDFYPCLNIEAIHAGLPSSFLDAAVALDTIDVASTFPASTFLMKRREDFVQGKPSTLLQVAFLYKIRGVIRGRVLSENIDSLRIVQYWRERPGSYILSDFNTEFPGNVAAEKGQLPVLQYLHPTMEPFAERMITDYAMDFAARNGHFEVVKFLHDHRTEGCSLSAIHGAAMIGRLDIVRFLHTHRSEMTSPHVLSGATRYGHLDVVKFLVENGIGGEPSQAALDEAAAEGHIDVLKFLFNISTVRCTSEGMDDAARKGHLSVVKFLHEHHNLGCSEVGMIYHGADLEHIKFLVSTHTVDTVRAAFRLCVSVSSKDGQEIIPVLQSLLEQYRDVDLGEILPKAALHGHLEIIMYLHGIHSNGWTPAVMDQAAAGGHLALVKWLHENRTEGCTTEAMEEAAREGHFDVIKFLHYNRSEGCTEGAMNVAAGCGHLDIVKWLHYNRSEGCGCWAMDWAAKEGRLDIVKWLHENRSEGCTEDAMSLAAAKGHLETVVWLHRNRTEGCTAAALGEAAANGHLEVVKFLYRNRREVCLRKGLERAIDRNRFEVFKFLIQFRKEQLNIKEWKNKWFRGFEIREWFDEYDDGDNGEDVDESAHQCQAHREDDYDSDDSYI